MDPGWRAFVPPTPPWPRVAAEAVAVGAVTGAALYFWKHLTLVWALAGMALGVAWVLVPHLRGRDTLTITAEGVSCRRRAREWRLTYREIFRVYRFKEQWIFETQPPHRRHNFSLERHDEHARAMAAMLEERGRFYEMAWFDKLTSLL